MYGKILDESSSAYHAHEGISHSKLETFRKRPLLFKKRYIDKTLAPEATAAMLLGSALHCAVLEPSEYAHRYVTRPDGIDRRTKDGKAAYEAFTQANQGKDVLEREDAQIVENMAKSVQSHQLAMQLLGEGEPELTWRTPSTSVLLPHPLQCRTDWFNGVGGYIADLKTIDSLDSNGLAAFQRNLVNFGYHRQSGFYTDVLAKCGFSNLEWYFIVVEKREPYGCVVFRLSETAMRLGYNETQHDLQALSKCYADNHWPNLPTTIQKLDMPGWYTEAK